MFDDAPTESLTGYKIPRWTEQLNLDIASDPGLREQAARFYDRDPGIFMLRDVRDTVTSMLSLRMGRENWLDVAARPILAGKLAEPEFQRRFGKLAACAVQIGSPAALGALYWRYKTQAYFDYAALGWPLLPVKYESLVSEPEPVLRRIVSHLGLDWNPALLHHAEMQHTEIFPNGLAMGNTDPERAIDSRSVGQWKRCLSVSDVSAILEIAGDLNDRVQNLG